MKLYSFNSQQSIGKITHFNLGMNMGDKWLQTSPVKTCQLQCVDNNNFWNKRERRQLKCIRHHKGTRLSFWRWHNTEKVLDQQVVCGVWCAPSISCLAVAPRRSNLEIKGCKHILSLHQGFICINQGNSYLWSPGVQGVTMRVSHVSNDFNVVLNHKVFPPWRNQYNEHEWLSAKNPGIHSLCCNAELYVNYPSILLLV